MQVDKLSSDAVAVQDQQLGVLAGLQDSVSGLSDKLTQQVALLRREFKPALLATEVRNWGLSAVRMDLRYMCGFIRHLADRRQRLTQCRLTDSCCHPTCCVHVATCAQLHQTSAADFTKVQRQVEALEGRYALLAKELATFKVGDMCQESLAEVWTPWGVGLHDCFALSTSAALCAVLCCDGADC